MTPDQRIVAPVQKLGQSIRWAVTSRAIAHTLAGTVCVCLLIAWVDDRCQTYTLTGRWLNSISIALCAALGVAWVAKCYCSSRYDLRSVAALIEQCVPAIRGRLVNSLCFLQEPGPATDAAGSGCLKQATVAETAVRLEALSIPEIVRWQPVWTAWRRTILCLVILLVCVTIFPARAQIAIRRLVAPWQEVALKRDNHLDWIQLPQRVAAGSALTVRVEDRQRRDVDGVALWYRRASDGSIVTRRVPMQRSGTTWIYRWDTVDRDLQLRATGGDDASMPWSSIKVVAPPKLLSTQVLLRPPTYSGWPSSTQRGPLTALAGTEAQVKIHADRPLAAARLYVQDRQAVRELALVPTNSHRLDFTTVGDPWLLRDTGEYWFSLQDADGVWSETERHRIVVQPDRSPTVHWRRPLSAEWMSPRTILWLEGNAEDDYGVAALRWELRVSRNRAEVRPSIGREIPSPAELSPSAQWSWRRPLAAFGHFQPGETIGLRIIATDVAGQTVKTPWREWPLRSEDEVVTALNRRWNRIIQRTRDSKQQQAHNLLASQSWRGSQFPDESAAQASLDAMAAAQSRLQDDLLRARDSILANTEALCGALDRCGLPVSHLQQASEQLRQRLQQWMSTHVSRLDRLLAAGLSPDNLREFGELQTILLKSLEDALVESDHWQQLAMLVRDVGWMIQTQREELAATRMQQLADLRATRPQFKDRPSASEALDARWVCRQLAVWRDQAEGWLQRAGEHDALTTMGRDRLRAGLMYLRQQATERIAYRAAEGLRDRRWNLAAEQQAQVLQDLESLLALLQGPRNGSPSPPTSESNAASDAPAAAKSAPTAGHAPESRGNDRAGTPGDSPAAKSIPVTTDGSTTGTPDPRRGHAWGTLPPRVRQALQQGMTEDVLPGYERTIADYYRRLRDD